MGFGFDLGFGLSTMRFWALSPFFSFCTIVYSVSFVCPSRLINVKQEMFNNSGYKYFNSDHREHICAHNYIIKLACSFESNIESTNTRKNVGYNPLKTDLIVLAPNSIWGQIKRLCFKIKQNKHDEYLSDEQTETQCV